ncbi:STAS domain-containing protein [Kitasatospora sp. NPDC101176]|uniref:STAS domain-containing protein n=1 Tax=Kitasatospora sp. NPDC101176 TaxID=3364099 RepID=UPI003810E2B6
MPAYALTIHVSAHAAGATVVVLAGELDYHTAPRLRRAIEGTPTALPLVLDITGLRFCDSMGIAELVFASLRAGTPGTPLPLVGAPADLRHLLTLTGVDQLVSHHAHVDQAVGSPCSPAPGPPDRTDRS